MFPRAFQTLLARRPAPGGLGLRLNQDTFIEMANDVPKNM